MTMSSACVPLFQQYLGVLSDLLAKAEAHAAARKIDPGALLGARLYPDMYPVIAQVQFSCDFAKGAVARLAGIENPPFADSETTFAQLHERIERTLAFIASVDPAKIDGSEARPVSLKFGSLELAAAGQDYLVGFALPSFLFHVSIAYALLRHSGVEIGKLDFLGQIPGMTGLPLEKGG
jgi:hypothetical protein